MGADEVDAGQCCGSVNGLGQAPGSRARCAHAVHFPLQQQYRADQSTSILPVWICRLDMHREQRRITWLQADAIVRCLSSAARPDAYRRCPALTPDVLLMWLKVMGGLQSARTGG